MSFSTLLFLIISFSLFSFFFSSNSALKKIKVATVKPSALPKHYGQNSIVWTLFPAFLLLIVITIIGPKFVDNIYIQKISSSNENKIVYLQNQTICGKALIYLAFYTLL